MIVSFLMTSTGRRAHEARVKEREATASGGEWGAGFVGAQGTGAEAKSGAHARPLGGLRSRKVGRQKEENPRHDQGRDRTP